MKCPKCGINVTDKNVIKEDNIYKCPQCNEVLEDYQEEVVVEEVKEEVVVKTTTPTISKDKLLNIAKFIVGLIFIGVAIFIVFNNTNNKTSYSSITDKYEETNGSLLRSKKTDNDRYEAYYEYEYNTIKYTAISDKTYATENDVPKNVIIQVDKNNPESYNIGEFEEPKANNTPYIIASILAVFGIGSCVLYGSKIAKKEEK